MKKLAIVTGASGNLGFGVTENLLNNGFDVHAFISPWENDRVPESENIISEKIDLCDEDLVEKSLEKVFGERGIPDLVITCAGGFAMDNLDNSSLDSFKDMLQMNFITAFNVAGKCFRKMSEENKQAKIIMIGARQGIKPEASLQTISYGLSKSLLFNYSKMLNEAGSEKNIQSHVVVPSIIDTPPNREAMPDADFNDWVSISDLVETVNFLISDTGSKVRQNEIQIYNRV